jgi:hypothetical protein
MANTTLVPNTVALSGGFTANGAADIALCTDEGTASHDGDTTYAKAAASNAGRMELTATPGDFDVATNYQIKIVAKNVGGVDDTFAIDTFIMNAGSTIDGNSDPHTIPNGTGTYALYTGTQRTNTAAKAAWDDYEVQLTPSRTSSGMADTYDVRVTAIDVDLVYTAVAGGNVSVTPGVATLTLATFAPTVTASAHKTVTPTTAALTLATFAPTVRLGFNVVPTTATLTTATFAPTVATTAHTTVTPTTASLTLATFAPTVSAPRLVTPGVASLTLATFAPTVSAPRLVTPTTASLTAATFAPTVTATAHVTVTPAAAALTLTTFEPTVTATSGSGASVTPTTASLTLSTFAPTVLTPVTVTPVTATLTLTSFAPTVSAPRLVTPTTASLTLTTFAPSVLAPRLVTPTTAALTLTTFAPSVGVTVPASIDVTLFQDTTPIATWNDVEVPDAITDLELTLTEAEIATITFPASDLIVEVTATLVPGYKARFYEVNLALPPFVVTPATASLTLTTFAPTVTTTAHQSVTPTTATLTLTGFAPTVLTPRLITPATATLTLTTFAPTVSTPSLVTPATASLVLTTFAPTVTTLVAVEIDVVLKQSTTTIATWSDTTVPDAITDIELVLTEAEIATISFPASDLIVEVTATINGAYKVRVYEISLTLPAPVPGETVTPDPASLVLTGFAPTVTASDHKQATPSTAALVLATFAPTVSATGHVSVTPSTASLVLTTFAPVVSFTAHVAVTPLTAALVLLTYAPTVLVEAIDFPGSARAYLILLGHAIASVHALGPRPRPGVYRLGDATGKAVILEQVSGMISPVGAGNTRLGPWQSS